MGHQNAQGQDLPPLFRRLLYLSARHLLPRRPLIPLTGRKQISFRVPYPGPVEIQGRSHLFGAAVMLQDLDVQSQIVDLQISRESKF